MSENDKVDEMTTLFSTERVQQKNGTTVLLCFKESFGYFFRGIYMVLKHHTCPVRTIKRLRVSLFNNFKSKNLNETKLISFYKYFITKFMAIYLKNPLPAKPEGWDYQLPKLVKRWFQPRLSVYKEKNTHLWFSLYQSKRSCLEVNDSYIFDAYKEHKKSLTMKINYDNDIIDEILHIMKPLLTKLNGQLLKDPNNKYLTPEAFVINRYSSISQSAHFAAGRNVGGARGYLSDELLSPLDILSFNDLMSMDNITGEYNGITVNNKVIETRQHVENTLTLEMHLLQHLNEILDNGNKIPDASVFGIVEPLKVRTITAGDATKYYLAKIFQKDLWKIMKEIPCFNLIGKSVMEEDIEFLKEHCLFKDFDDLHWDSTDYKSATDRIAPRLQKGLLRGLIHNFDFRIQKLLHLVNGPHMIHYPVVTVNGKKKSIESMKQENGQLMGNPISFLLLCLANLGLYLYTVRHMPAPLKEKLNSVKINGDDKLYRAPRDFCEYSLNFGKSIGLENSVGKSYIHRSYANINSVCFHSSEEWETKRINFLNTGLIFNQHKVMRVTNKELSKSHVVDIINEILDGSLESQKEEVLKEFLSRFKKEVKREQTFQLMDGNIRKAYQKIKQLRYEILRTTYKFQNLFFHEAPSNSFFGTLVKLSESRWSEEFKFQFHLLFGKLTNHQIELSKTNQKLQKLRKRRFIKNLFIPVHLGGMGVNKPDNFKNKISIQQRRLASKKLEEFTLPCKNHYYKKDEWFSITAWTENIESPVSYDEKQILISDRKCYLSKEEIIVETELISSEDPFKVVENIITTHDKAPEPNRSGVDQADALEPELVTASTLRYSSHYCAFGDDSEKSWQAQKRILNNQIQGVEKYIKSGSYRLALEDKHMLMQSSENNILSVLLERPKRK